jgi:hypothetical protein
MSGGDEENLHYCLVLNFVQQNFEKRIDDEIIKKFGAKFFDVDDIVKAKKWLGSKLYPEALFQKRTGSKASLSHLGDILDFIKNGNTIISKSKYFFILSPNEVPSIPATAYSTLFSRVNELHVQLKKISNQFEAYSTIFCHYHSLEAVPRNQPIATLLLLSLNCHRQLVIRQTVRTYLPIKWS